MNSPERDNREPPPVDVDAELELEPPDEAVEARQRQIALDAIRANINLDAIYGDVERDHGSDLVAEWLRDFRFRFQVKHLLIATAVLSVVMALITLKLLWTALVLGFMLSVAGAYLYIRWDEQKREADAARRREALYARRRELSGANAVEEPSKATGLPPLPSAIDEAWQKSLEKEAFRFQFSLQQLLILITIAAVVLGTMRLFGGAETLASVLGLVALFGLVLYAVGMEVPQVFALSWWIVLALYVVLSISTAMLSLFH